MELSMMNLPSSALRNSPSLFKSFRAFHCVGLWLAVRMMPPSALNSVTAISVVGVVARSMSTTSTPQNVSVPITIFLTSGPEILASRPTTTLYLGFCDWVLSHLEYAVVNFTMSNGVRLSPDLPPIVPRIPEIDFISVIYIIFFNNQLSPNSTP